MNKLFITLHLTIHPNLSTLLPSKLQLLNIQSKSHSSIPTSTRSCFNIQILLFALIHFIFFQIKSLYEPDIHID